MESLHPVAQVTAIIVIGLVVCVVVLTTTDFFDNITKKK
jgi:hypothetical protein